MVAWGRGRGEGVRIPAGEEIAEEADKVEIAPRVTVASLRRFRAALIGSKDFPSGVGCADTEA